MFAPLFVRLARASSIIFRRSGGISDRAALSPFRKVDEGNILMDSNAASRIYFDANSFLAALFTFVFICIRFSNLIWIQAAGANAQEQQQWNGQLQQISFIRFELYSDFAPKQIKNWRGLPTDGKILTKWISLHADSLYTPKPRITFILSKYSKPIWAELNRYDLKKLTMFSSCWFERQNKHLLPPHSTLLSLSFQAYYYRAPIERFNECQREKNEIKTRCENTLLMLISWKSISPSSSISHPFYAII